jgi:hypothetical protein
MTLYGPPARPALDAGTNRLYTRCAARCKFLSICVASRQAIGDCSLQHVDPDQRSKLVALHPHLLCLKPTFERFRAADFALVRLSSVKQVVLSPLPRLVLHCSCLRRWRARLEG